MSLLFVHLVIPLKPWMTTNICASFVLAINYLEKGRFGTLFFMKYALLGLWLYFAVAAFAFELVHAESTHCTFESSISFMAFPL